MKRKELSLDRLFVVLTRFGTSGGSHREKRWAVSNFCAVPEGKRGTYDDAVTSIQQIQKLNAKISLRSLSSERCDPKRMRQYLNGSRRISCQKLTRLLRMMLRLCC